MLKKSFGNRGKIYQRNFENLFTEPPKNIRHSFQNCMYILLIFVPEFENGFNGMNSNT